MPGDSAIEQLLQRYLPPYTFRAGYQNNENPFPEGLMHVDLKEAEQESLETLYVKFEKSPEKFEEFIGLLDLLTPGGIGFIRLDLTLWDKNKLSKLSRATGFQILYYEKFSEAGNKIEFITVIQKPSLAGNQARQKLISIVIPFYGSRSFDRTADTWHEFLKQFNLLEISEIIVVDDGYTSNSAILEVSYKKSENSVNFVGHYKPFGRQEAIKTGMIHSNGRYILIDETRQGVPARELFTVLNLIMHDNKNLSGCITGIQAWDPVKKRKKSRTLKGRFTKRLTGSVQPQTGFRIYHFQAARELLKKKFKNHRVEPLIYLKRKGFRIQDVSVEGNLFESSPPGLFRLAGLYAASFFK